MWRRLEGDGVVRHGAAQLLLWSAFYYQLPALLPHMADNGLDVGVLSAAITAAILVWALLIPVAGRLVDRGHGVTMMRFGGGLGVALLVTMSIVPTPLVPLVIAGLGMPMAATLYDPCFAILLRARALVANRAITKVTLVAGFATLLSFPVVLLISSFWPWQGVVLVFSGIAAVGVWAIPDMESGRPITPQSETRDRQTWKWKGIADVALIALPFGLAMFSHAALLFLLPLALLNMDAANGWALYLPTVLGPAQIAGRLLWQRFAHQNNPNGAASILFVLFLLPPFMLLSVQSHWMGVLLALLVQGGLYGIHTVLRPLVAAAALPAESLGQTIGVIAMVGLLMMAAAPGLGGMLLQNVGYMGLIVSLLAINAIALGLALLAQFGSRGRGAWIRS